MVADIYCLSKKVLRIDVLHYKFYYVQHQCNPLLLCWEFIYTHMCDSTGSSLFRLFMWKCFLLVHLLYYLSDDPKSGRACDQFTWKLSPYNKTHRTTQTHAEHQNPIFLCFSRRTTQVEPSTATLRVDVFTKVDSTGSRLVAYSQLWLPTDIQKSTTFCVLVVQHKYNHQLLC